MSLSFARLLALLVLPLSFASSHRDMPARSTGPGRRSRPASLDPETAPDSLLRDLGLRDGRGPSLRQPERLPQG